MALSTSHGEAQRGAATPLYRVAQRCALAPLVTGVGIFVVWTVVRWEPLEVAGLLCIAAGVPTVGAGLLCLLVAVSRGELAGARAGAGVVALLLLLNFPVAYAIVAAAARIKYPMSTVAVADVTRETSIVLTTELAPHSLSIEVSGHLDGRATLKVGYPSGETVTIGPGAFAVRLPIADWFAQTCTLQYTPVDVKSGAVTLTYRFEGLGG